MRRDNSEPHKEEVAAWEAYHGAWINKARTMPPGAVRFFRFEDLTTTGCTAPLADPAIALRYQNWAAKHSFTRMRMAGLVGNETVWRFWNYTDNGSLTTTPRINEHDVVVSPSGQAAPNGLWPR